MAKLDIPGGRPAKSQSSSRHENILSHDVQPALVAHGGGLGSEFGEPHRRKHAPSD